MAHIIRINKLTKWTITFECDQLICKYPVLCSRIESQWLVFFFHLSQFPQMKSARNMKAFDLKHYNLPEMTNVYGIKFHMPFLRRNEIHKRSRITVLQAMINIVIVHFKYSPAATLFSVKNFRYVLLWNKMNALRIFLSD